MNRLVRMIVAIVLVEGLLAGLWWYLLQPDPATGRIAYDPVTGPAKLGEIMGTAMGAALGFAIFLHVIGTVAARKKAS